MPVTIHYETVSPLLKELLKFLMNEELFNDFRLVGGTALSLTRGHRKSNDIDLFTDVSYGTVDFQAIDKELGSVYSYVDTLSIPAMGLGKSYYVGEGDTACIKLDIYTTDPFVWPVSLIEGIRMANVEEIIAMKLDVIYRGGRKKDFWDIHEFISDYSYTEMLAFHQKRYPYTHNPEEITRGFTNCNNADNDFEPVCLRGKYWELIKLDLIEFSR
jgi:hypothetical protein